MNGSDEELAMKSSSSSAAAALSLSLSSTTKGEEDVVTTSSSRDETCKTKKKKRKRNSNNNVLNAQRGEQGSLTPTQLRNARKRHAKQVKRQQHQQSQSDPSQQYLSNPKGAPIVKAALHYFSHSKILPTNEVFGVTMSGPTMGWRTVAKLAVRKPSSSSSSPEDGKDHPPQVMIGLFAPKSHQLIPVPHCVAHHPSINDTIVMMEKLCRQVGVKAFDETTGTGHLRHIAINVERATGKVQITLVWNSKPYHNLETTSKEEEDDNDDDDGKAKNVLDALCKAVIAVSTSPVIGEHNPSRKRRRRGRREGTKELHDNTMSVPKGGKMSEPLLDEEEKGTIGLLHSLWVHYNSSWKHSNAIFSMEGGGKECWEHRYGPLCLMETLNLTETGDLKYSVRLRFPPNVFRQANLDAFTKIVAEIRRRLAKFGRQQRQRDSRGGASSQQLPTCVELYGGVGTIGLHVVDLVSSLVSSDENPFNEACFVESALELPKDMAQRVSYKPMNATDMIQSRALDQVDVVIVDPPRKGLEDTVLQALCTTEASSSPRLLVYVSCGFDAFQRDCNALVNSNKWRLDHAEGHLLFPGSDAIETLAIFVRERVD